MIFTKRPKPGLNHKRGQHQLAAFLAVYLNIYLGVFRLSIMFFLLYVFICVRLCNLFMCNLPWGYTFRLLPPCSHDNGSSHIPWDFSRDSTAHHFYRQQGPRCALMPFRLTWCPCGACRPWTQQSQCAIGNWTSFRLTEFDIFTSIATTVSVVQRI